MDQLKPELNQATTVEHVNLTEQKSWFQRHKILSTIVIVALVFILGLATIAFIVIGKLTNTGISKKTDLNDKYAKSWQGIYFKTSCSNIFGSSCNYEFMKDADKDSFAVIPDHNDGNYLVGTAYAKDKNHVFLEGKIVDGADPNTFSLLDSGYASDANWNYHEETQEVNEKDVMFRRYLIRVAKNDDMGVKPTIEGNWQIYPDKLFFNGKVVTGLDNKTFKKFNENYYEDKNYLIWVGNLTPEAVLIEKDPKSKFQVIDKYGNALKDSTRVVYDGVILKGANPSKFAFLQTADGRSLVPVGSDGTNVYQFYTLVPEADGATFINVDCNQSYFKDKNHVYFNYPSKMILVEGIDPNTFRSGLYGRIADRNGVYEYVGDFSGKPKLLSTDSSNFQAITCKN